MFGTHVFGNLRVISASCSPCSATSAAASSPSPPARSCRPTKRARASTFYGWARGRLPARQAAQYSATTACEGAQVSNIACNASASRSRHHHGSDEQEQMRRRIAQRLGTYQQQLRRAACADNVVPLALHLAASAPHPASPAAGSAPAYNETQGLGGFEAWGYPPDVAAARASGRL